MVIRDQGDWESWLEFFLRGVVETAEQATIISRGILSLREVHQSLLQGTGLERHGYRLLDLLFRRPVINVRLVERELDLSYRTANSLLARFEELGIVTETTGARRNRRFQYTLYLRFFAQPDAIDDAMHQAPEP